MAYADLQTNLLVEATSLTANAQAETSLADLPIQVGGGLQWRGVAVQQGAQSSVGSK